MHHGYWHDGDGGNWWWIPMLVMMIVFWGGLAWVIVSIVRHNATHRHDVVPPNPPMPGGPAPHHRPPLDPRQVLAERLARGEIDVDDYRARLAALDDTHPPRP